jgi:sulfate ABC transporter permease protein CysW/sulfate ABC transporter permease protein CysT
VLGLSTAYLTLIVLIPIAAVVVSSLEGGLAAFWDEVTSPAAVAALKLTFVASLLVVLVNAVTGTLIAWVLVRDDFRGKSIVNAIIDLPFALPTIVAGLTLLAVYGPRSPVDIDVSYTRAAVVVALLFVTLPFVVRAVQPVLLELDREMEDAAASLGARPFTTFRRIILPNLLPAMLSGAALSFGKAVGEFGSIVLISGNIPFDTEVASVWIFKAIESDQPRQSRSCSSFSPSLSSPSPTCSSGAVGGTMRRGASRYALRTVALGYLALLLALPFSAIVYYTFRDGVEPVWEAVTDPSFVAAFKLTVIAVGIAVPANTIFGVACAMALVRRPPKHGTWLLNSLIGLPLALSPVVVGLALILVYGQDGWFGSWLTENGIRIIFSTPGIVLATIFVTLPFVVREVIPVLREVGTDQDEAAWTLGASRFQTFRRVTLPAIRWGVAYGVVLTTARALGEYGAVAVVSGRIAGKTETLTLHVDEEYLRFNEVAAYATSLVLAFLAVLTLIAMNLFKPKEYKEVADVDRRPPGHEAV